ncbi:hypothetical protein [Pseudomonas orientalis]|uniref:Uncharacterized protein n=1 Tax=Pseudomonas orientalis TaxID=76758 RepID=A0A4Q7CX95_9PSED|nr:hypothetical protein [Pseudomonas orientalis]RZI31025.1 hypothetical protein EUX57_14285 [Pseudomonas orientalis]
MGEQGKNNVQRKVELQNSDGLGAIFKVLNDDIELVYPHTPNGDGTALYQDPATLTQSQRRVLIRAIFAFVEGLSYTIRMSLVKSHAEHLSPSVIMALSEQQIDVKESGVVGVKSIKASLMSLVRLTVTQFSSCYPDRFKVKCSGPDFEALASSVRVRDRLMHPRSAADLFIDDGEAMRAAKGFFWFHRAFVLMLEAETAVLRELVERQNKLLNNLAEERGRLIADLDRANALKKSDLPK